ncbi:hypothetical protein [Nonomuraea sp. NPDC048826]|uniref:hypothetical protein n=1 Tax=Nonomuraea sp. NPDC048826 TaxID=3364347 RepID=UPI003718BC67
MTLLAEQFARSDASLRQLQARADRAGGERLPRATCADMLAGRRFPKKGLMMAFLRACQVPESHLPAWERAWERACLARMPAASRPGDETRAAPARAVRWKQRRVVVPVILTAVAVAGALGMFISCAPNPIITDDGRAFGRGGSSRFTVTVDPANTGVRLTRRLDASVGRQCATIQVNGTPAGQWNPLPATGLRYRWRDQLFHIPPQLTAGRSSLTVVNTFKDSTIDFNEFRYTVEHKVRGAWDVAAVVDVGNAASEAEHGYRLTGLETFDGHRTSAYPPSAHLRP